MNRFHPFFPDPLPYEPSALEPHLCERLIHLHYDKHTKGYADRLNLLLEPYDPELSLEELITQCHQLPLKIREDVHNNAGGLFNHNFYFQSMTPYIDRRFSDTMYAALDAAFGSIDYFRLQFRNAAIKVFGSGWAWLACDRKGALRICTTPGHNTPLEIGLIPLLCVDCWEHAYYLQYENRREDYFDNWFQLIDWVRVESRYRTALQCR